MQRHLLFLRHLMGNRWMILKSYGSGMGFVMLLPPSRRVVSRLKSCLPMGKGRISGGQCWVYWHNVSNKSLVSSELYATCQLVKLTHSLITYYLTSVLSGMGLSDLMSRIISGVNGTCYFLTSLIAITIIERVGRRPLMLWTAAAQCVTMAVLAGLYNIEHEGNKAAQGVSVLCLFLFNTWFSIGWLGMTWLYPAEITPLRIRAPANALSTASNWIFNFMVGFLLLSCLSSFLPFLHSFCISFPLVLLSGIRSMLTHRW
jgi:hypothetical protein